MKTILNNYIKYFKETLELSLKYIIMNKSFQYRIYPTPQQQSILAKTFGHNRFVWNHCLESRIQLYQEQKKSTNWIGLSNGLVQLKKDYPFLKEANSQTYQQTLKHQDRAFKAFFKNPKQFGFPNTKSRKSKQSVTIPQHIKVDTESGYTTICKVGNVPTIFHRPLDGKIQHATITKTKAGNYYISFCCKLEVEVEKEPVSSETTIGIDVGLKDFAVLSDGTKIANPRFMKASQARLKHEQRKHSRKVKGSKSREKQRVKLAKLSEHVANQRKDFLQKLSTSIVSDSQVGSVVAEDLNVKGMMKNHKLAGAIGDVGWNDFSRMLQYKCEWTGKNFLQIGRFEPSSKTCSDCGFVNTGLTLKDRSWLCPSCGREHDRDINAAVNIKNMKLKSLGLRNDPVHLAPGATLEQVKERLVEQIASKTLHMDVSSYCYEAGKYRARQLV
jgi:putative transposase